MAYQWIAVAARTGRMLTELPDLSVGSVSVQLSQYETTTATLPVPTAPMEWVRATAPYAAMLVLEDIETGTPVWGGIITRRTRTHRDEVSLSLSTIEAYLDRRYVGDVTYSGVEQCTLAADLVARFVQDGTTPLMVETTPGVTTRTRTYEHESDKTVLTALQELAAVQNGPEFTVTWRRIDDPAGVRFVPVLTIADRLGQTTPDGLAPGATLDMPGVITDCELVEDWTARAGANYILATSSTNAIEDADEDTPRPESSPAIFLDPDRPTVEYRWTPSTSITQIATLDQHAARALSSMKNGGQTLSLSVSTLTGPRLGEDWAIGDDIGYAIQAPAWPGGLAGVARVAGWTLNLDAATVDVLLFEESPFVTVEDSA